MSIETSFGLETGQPYPYRRAELVEPDWTRVPGWADVTTEDWESVQWQRAHCIKNVRQLRALWGDLVDETFYEDLEREDFVDLECHARDAAFLSRPARGSGRGKRRRSHRGARTASR